MVVETTKINIWAFYLSNGSIERRSDEPTAPLNTKEDAIKRYPFAKWHPGIEILKVVKIIDEKHSEVCPKNNNAHHLIPQSNLRCPFCGGKNSIVCR